jgi:large subunit ribosomal protein L37Ae
MAKRTAKVGIVGKYGTRYGGSIRKQIKRIEVAQHRCSQSTSPIHAVHHI